MFFQISKAKDERYNGVNKHTYIHTHTHTAELHKISSDGGDFPRIIEIALFCHFSIYLQVIHYLEVLVRRNWLITPPPAMYLAVLIDFTKTSNTKKIVLNEWFGKVTKNHMGEW